MPHSQLLVSHLKTQYAGKKILILGFGREGQSTYSLLASFLEQDQLYVMDQRWLQATEFSNQEIKTLQNAAPNIIDYDLTQLAKFEVIFKTPGIPGSLPELQAYVKAGGLLTSQTNELLACYRQQVIGVTGTKGKSTTASLITHLLTTAGKSSVLVGNIGKPIFDYLNEISADTLIVAELSSYQLEMVQYSPHYAIWLDLFSEHLNYHGGVQQYAAAKAQITLHQTPQDEFFYDQDFPIISDLTAQTVAHKQPFHLKDSALQLMKLGVTGFAALPKIVQEHNVLPAVLVCQSLGLTPEQISAGLSTFKSLPHRLEKVGVFNGITFIDDTLATIPEAAVAALEAFPTTTVLMVGGFDRGLDFTPIVDAIVKHKIPYVLFFPTTGLKMLEILQQKYSGTTLPTYKVVENMKDAVKQCYEWLPNGGVVVLSPASPSFGQFKDYEDKSEQYKEAIKLFAQVSSS